MIKWIVITNPNQLNEIALLNNKVSVIFKHSTRCSISSMAKARLEREPLNPIYDSVSFYFLDLLNYRFISNDVEERFSIEHQSPQILLIKNGKCIYNASHNEIQIESICEFMSNEIEHFA